MLDYETSTKWKNGFKEIFKGFKITGYEVGDFDLRYIYELILDLVKSVFKGLFETEAGITTTEAP